MMAIALPKQQIDWLEARVADGTFNSVDEAAAKIIEERMLLEADDLAWAADAVAEARRDIAAGRTMTLEEHRTRNAIRLTRIGG
jgi:Arc/MetJ-type ribon-helix-helix transcriptional regulator